MEAEKRCIKCEKVKPADEFYRRSDSGSLTGECKTCRKTRSTRYFQENIDLHHALTKRRYETFGRFARYGLTPEQYDDALREQGGNCQLCHADKPGGKGVWHIDHGHTGEDRRNIFKQATAEEFRGLLCHRCNISLGHYEKLVTRIGEEAIKSYLAQRPLEASPCEAPNDYRLQADERPRQTDAESANPEA